MDDDPAPEPDSQARPGPAQRHGARLIIDLVEDAGDWTALGNVEARLPPIAAAIATHVDLDGDAVIALALSDDANVQTLNRTYRGKDKPTNVLSFPAAPAVARASGGPDMLGDVVIAAETLAREAAEQDIPLPHHFDHLVVHGVLHLLGFDHETDADADDMEALEVAVLRALDIPDPYVGGILED